MIKRKIQLILALQDYSKRKERKNDLFAIYNNGTWKIDKNVPLKNCTFAGRISDYFDRFDTIEEIRKKLSIIEIELI